jgi:hypothetical protein
VPKPLNSQSQSGNHQAVALQISLLGADKAVKVKGADELPGRSNYFIGNDSNRWRSNVPAYSRVKYKASIQELTCCSMATSASWSMTS